MSHVQTHEIKPLYFLCIKLSIPVSRMQPPTPQQRPCTPSCIKNIEFQKIKKTIFTYGCGNGTGHTNLVLLMSNERLERGIYNSQNLRVTIKKILVLEVKFHGGKCWK